MWPYEKIFSLARLRTDESMMELERMIREHFSPNLEIAEIGSFMGESTVAFARKIKRVDAIDPWSEDSIKLSLSGSINRSINDFSEIIASKLTGAVVEEIFDQRTQKIMSIHKHKCEYQNYRTSASLDGIYVDAIHNYEFTKDCLLYFTDKYSSLKFTSGHDYNEDWPEVMQAVDDVVGIPDQVYGEGSWIKWI